MGFSSVTIPGKAADQYPMILAPLAELKPPVVEREPLRRSPVTLLIVGRNYAHHVERMATRLQSLLEQTSAHARTKLLIIDDASTDDTWSRLKRTARPDWELVRNDFPFGPTLALMAGLRRAGCETVITLEPDSIPKSEELEAWIALLAHGVDMVLVPRAGRTRTSRLGNWLYRQVLRFRWSDPLTPCRVIRRTSVAHLQPVERGASGSVEILGRLEAAGATIVEFPEPSREIQGESPVARPWLMARIVLGRLSGKWAANPRDSVLRAIMESHRNEQAMLFREKP